MQSPPKLLEKIVEWLIPPACRENVAGDLHERYTSAVQYIVDALRTVPMVVISRMRRSSDAQLVLMQALVLYLSFLASAWYNQAALLSEETGLLRLAIPVGIALLGLMIHDAYAVSRKHSWLSPVRGPAFSLALAFACEYVLSIGGGELALPRWIMFFGAAIALLLTAAVRMIFPPATERSQGPTGPAAL
jgi:hypothetical protein